MRVPHQPVWLKNKLAKKKVVATHVVSSHPDPDPPTPNTANAITTMSAMKLVALVILAVTPVSAFMGSPLMARYAFTTPYVWPPPRPVTHMAMTSSVPPQPSPSPHTTAAGEPQARL